MNEIPRSSAFRCKTQDMRLYSSVACPRLKSAFSYLANMLEGIPRATHPSVICSHSAVTVLLAFVADKNLNSVFSRIPSK